MSAIFDTKFKPKTKARFILRCPAKKCKSVMACDTPMKSERRYTRGFVGVPGSAEPYNVVIADRSFLPEVYCPQHKRQLLADEVKGTVTDCPCDRRCTGAKGHNCDCSCGGANHGAEFLI